MTIGLAQTGRGFGECGVDSRAEAGGGGIAMHQREARSAGRDLRVDGAIARGPEIEILVDGEPVRAFTGETVAAALLAAGRKALRRTARRAEPRGVYCGMGICFDCVMTIDGRPNVRTCQTPVRQRMRVEANPPSLGGKGEMLAGEAL